MPASRLPPQPHSEPVKILVVHNRYRQAGGEDEVVRAETDVLRAAGHDVAEYGRTNDEIADDGLLSRARLAAGTVWSRATRVSLGDVLARFRPDVAHVHNTLPLISPAAYYTCRDAGVAVVQTLHNYRLLCPAASLFRAGRVCEECVDHGLIRGIRHRCYRGSRGATAAVATMLAVHRTIGTWRERVDAYIALSEFARDKFIAAGLPADKILVKPNFVHPDPGPRQCAGEDAVVVGRLSAEKGVRNVLDAWARLGQPLGLEIIGDGPERTRIEAVASQLRNVNVRGRLSREMTVAAMKRARFLIFPSECYEGLPMTVIEAYACGVPVIASRLGTTAEIVHDGQTGLHFNAGDAADLAAKVQWAWSHPNQLDEMGRAARAEFEAKYTAARNYDMLMSIYARAIAGHRGANAAARRAVSAAGTRWASGR